LEIYQGIINTYTPHKGCGFIRREKGKDVFFSIDDVREYEELELLCRVSFEIIRDKKGLKAQSIELIRAGS